MRATAATKTDSGLAVRLAALASLGAAVIHCAVVPTHWQEWIPAGLFFVAVALFQLVWAYAVITRATTPVLVAGIMVNLGVVALWALTRTEGAPFGPHAGVAEVVQAADLCAAVLEIYVVMGAGWAWYRRHQGELIPGYANALILLGAFAVVTLASTVGVVSGLRHGHHAPSMAESGHHGPSGGHADAQHAHPPEPPSAESAGVVDSPEPVAVPAAPPQPSHDGHDDHDHG
ncbi:hypothetical protein [Mycolicibacterium chlorophenolicum]|uniref:Uncharacterized protein n=1 Tax=Mycolicibacterium chlorophenolicum TaxID=37916 RepID=A0A0J6VIG7_9MYCO|nr:hypothetical protein [Mycolicibacterium chlorophenolicum]KMO70795.1 hypothetical protein MCHLDSM_05688 [Mycolicibacterium chlorophenolicum]